MIVKHDHAEPTPDELRQRIADSLARYHQAIESNSPNDARAQAETVRFLREKLTAHELEIHQPPLENGVADVLNDPKKWTIAANRLLATLTTTKNT